MSFSLLSIENLGSVSNSVCLGSNLLFGTKQDKSAEKEVPAVATQTESPAPVVLSAMETGAGFGKAEYEILFYGEKRIAHQGYTKQAMKVNEEIDKFFKSLDLSFSGTKHQEDLYMMHSEEAQKELKEKHAAHEVAEKELCGGGVAVSRLADSKCFIAPEDSEIEFSVKFLGDVAEFSFAVTEKTFASCEKKHQDFISSTFAGTDENIKMAKSVIEASEMNKFNYIRPSKSNPNTKANFYATVTRKDSNNKDETCFVLVPGELQMKSEKEEAVPRICKNAADFFKSAMPDSKTQIIESLKKFISDLPSGDKRVKVSFGACKLLNRFHFEIIVSKENEIQN